MATPTNLPGSFSVGETLTSADMNLLRGAFRILQVVYGTATVAVGTASATWVDTGVTATITPQSSTSKILVYADHSTYSFGANTTGGLRLMRGGSQLQLFSDVGYNPGSYMLTTWSTIHLDSPGSTSALTYKTEQNRGLGSGTFYTQVNTNPGNIVLFEVSA
jgi:type IV secretory pathway TrbD component